MKKYIQFIGLGLALIYSLFAEANTSKPIFLITPVSKAPSTVYVGQIATATYQVTNNTPYALNGNGVVELPTGVTQISGGCTTPFNLAPGTSCILTLQIVADDISNQILGGPKVCNTLNNPIYCAIPSASNALNILKSNNPPPMTNITIGGNISGLASSGLVLQNNGGDNLTVSSGAATFEFATPIPYGGNYAITVANQPSGSLCSVTSNSTGMNVTANVNNIQINCTAVSVGTALNGGVVYRINGNTAYILSLTDVGASTIWSIGLTNVTTSMNNTFNTLDNTYTALAGNNFLAALACRNYTAGSGVNTWFLPARNEWSLVVANIAAINANSGTTGFTPFSSGSFYWSSTEETGDSAWGQLFSSSTSSSSAGSYKLNNLRVRCVQAVTF